MRFVFLAWMLTRLLVIGVLLGAGHLAAFDNWDGAWYGSVLTHGYEYARDGNQHNVAFFPLLPMMAWPLVHAGIPWPLAAALLTNTAFLGALVLLHACAKRAYDETAAHWCVAVACLLPPSLFCSVAYPQSLFLLFSAFALYSVGNGRYLAGGLGSAVASAASGLGIPLVAGIFADAVAKRRAVAAWCALIGFAGIGSFALYCQIRFGDALAFVHAQHAWRSGFGFAWPVWLVIARSLLTPDGFRQNVATLIVPLGVVAVLVESRRLGSAMTLYALFALALLLFSGVPFSVDRNGYAIVPVLIAFGAILRRVPPLGYVVLALSAVLLLIDAGRFAHFQWVAYVPLSAPM